MMERALIVGILLLPAAIPQDTPIKGRYETFSEKVAQGPKMKLVAATYFGVTEASRDRSPRLMFDLP